MTINKLNLIKTAAAVAAAAGLAVSAQVAFADSHDAEEMDVAERTEATVHTFADMETVIGDSTLRRTDSGVYATFWAGDHAPGHSYTLWWVIFNEPENCVEDMCGPADIFIDGDPAAGMNEEGLTAADVVISYAAGTIANDDGEVYLVGRLDQGAAPTGAIFGEGAALKDAAAAEIHLVTRSHGPAIEGIEDIQLTSFEGGCENDLLPGEPAENEGDCADYAFAVFLP